MTNRSLRILGIRGVPAAHGGFETFAENLAPYLVERGWTVTVYCQEEGTGPITEDTWRGVRRVVIPVQGNGAKSTIVFDWLSIKHAAAESKDLCLTLGYNTAVFCAWLRLKGVPNLINMDGIEYTRAKWGPVARLWFRINEIAGCWLANHLVADNPEIKKHLSQKIRADKITTIAYGADEVTQASDEPIRALGLEPGKYLSVIARPEPENSVLEIIRGFSARTRGLKLAVLGNFTESVEYHRAVMAAAGPEVMFLGAIYDKPVVQALRFHSLAYLHGHQVGGTNPSLVEALGAGNAVIAHDNRFNRWVIGNDAEFFSDEQQLASVLDTLLSNEAHLVSLRERCGRRFRKAFSWDGILGQYEELLGQYVPAESTAQADLAAAKGPAGSASKY